VTLAICILVASIAGFVAGWSLRSHYMRVCYIDWRSKG